jgi:hypothetical protein
MPNRIDSTRALAAVRTLEDTRAEARALFTPHHAEPRHTEDADGKSSPFPRSRTFQWLLTRHPVGRSLGSVLVTFALSRLPIGLLVTKALFHAR